MPTCAFTSGASSVMISFATVLMSFWPCSIPVKRARLVLSQSCSRILEDADLRVHQRRKLGHDQFCDRLDVLLALQHPGEARQVGLEPVLFAILRGRVAQVPDHLVDVLGEKPPFALRAVLDRAL